MRFIHEITSMKRDDWYQKFPANSVLANEASLQDHLLRTAVYWEIADIAKIPFMVDFLRIPTVAGYTVRIQQSIRMLIDAKVRLLNKKETDELQGLAGYTNVPIPNSFSNFLRSYQESSDLEDSFNGIRNEFSEERNKIIEWEKDLRRENITQKRSKLCIRCYLAWKNSEGQIGMILLCPLLRAW